jgi:mannose-6-phosphate isomerase-like protein (cupin superfamily)
MCLEKSHKFFEQNRNNNKYKLNRSKTMNQIDRHYKATSIGDIHTLGRVTLHKELALTGSEISINELPPGASVPFTHAHKKNEEVYIIVKGRGRFYVDGDEFSVAEGSVVRIDPKGERCLKAEVNEALRYICIQTEAGSLQQFTENDGIITKTKPSWLQ